MTAYEVIRNKRDKLELTFDEISWFINGHLEGNVSDYQMSALLMAIYLNGMSDSETVALTNALALSGETIDLGSFGNATVDKHSTGGVGDKTTLVVAPIAASLGCFVAKMSGRGLGFTGGTYDKLSSIPGYKITPEKDEFLAIVRKTGLSVVGQSDRLTPADKKIYALRDVTATVDSLPLIASSIMSKKIAAGAHSIVLDVKYGAGAFMKTPETALRLAETMVRIGKEQWRNTTAIITDMNVPLGFAVGNNLEVIEAVKLLQGANIPDLYRECVNIAALMVSSAKNIPFERAKVLSAEALDSGAAYNKFVQWISAQGGDVSYIENTNKFYRCKYSADVCAEKDGYLYKMDTEKIGETACLLGAGRKTVDDDIDYSAGIILNKKTGDYVERGERLCTLYSNDKSIIDLAKAMYGSAVEINDKRPESLPEIYKIVT